MTTVAASSAMPEELSPRHLRRRLLQVAAVLVVVAIIVSLLPGLGSLRNRFAHASAPWLAGAALLELLSVLSYVVVFRAVFCRRMSWRLSYQIGMSEQAANALLPASGAGGLALGAWALRRGGMSAEHIGRRTVAFFFLTSLANVGTVIVFAAAYAVGLLHRDRNAALTYGFGAAALAVTGLVLALPAIVKPKPRDEEQAPAGKIRSSLRVLHDSLGHGVRDAVALIRQRSMGVFVGSFCTMALDIAALGFCFRAFGAHPAVGVVVLGYLIGQLGGNIPVPGGIGGVDGGLIGAYALYGVPVAAATAAVLAYRVFSLWIPGLLGSAAFVQLRRTLQCEEQPAAMCSALAEPIETVALPPVAASAAG